MEKFRSRFIRFMYGRYGVDQLYKALFGAALVGLFANLFLQSPVMTAFVWLLLLLANYRVFSRNIYQRQRENSHYQKFETRVRKELKLASRRLKEVRYYRYRKCPNCQQVLRLKRKPGRHKTVCPKCNNTFDVHIIL